MTMKKSQWAGVFPAITTPFHADGSVDHAASPRTSSWLADAGCAGIVAGGSLGEAATLRSTRRSRSSRPASARSPDACPSSRGSPAWPRPSASRWRRAAERAGCDGLMALPPYVYYSATGARRARTTARSSRATSLSCMLYNNPIAYRHRRLAEQLAELADAHDESARGEGVERRRAARHARCARARRPARRLRRAGRHDPRGDRRGRERVDRRPGERAPATNRCALFELARAGRWERGDGALRLVPAAAAAGHRAEVRPADQARAGGARPRERAVRAPRLELVGAERDEALALIRERLACRPAPVRLRSAPATRR